MFMLAVVGLSFILLMIVFRSVFVPLKAAVPQRVSMAWLSVRSLLIAVHEWPRSVERKTFCAATYSVLSWATVRSRSSTSLACIGARSRWSRS